MTLACSCDDTRDLWCPVHGCAECGAHGAGPGQMCAVCGVFGAGEIRRQRFDLATMRQRGPFCGDCHQALALGDPRHHCPGPGDP